MRVEVKPSDNKDKLAENLSKRVGNAEVDGRTITVEVEEPEVLSRVPGIENYKVNGEKKDGLGGEPVDEQAYARLESRRDAVRALLATIMGYDLRILDTSREWDYRNLKRYNPSIKHLKFDEPREELKIEKALFDSEDLEKIEVKVEEEEVEQVYRSMLTG